MKRIKKLTGGFMNSSNGSIFTYKLKENKKSSRGDLLAKPSYDFQITVKEDLYSNDGTTITIPEAIMQSGLDQIYHYLVQSTTSSTKEI